VADDPWQLVAELTKRNAEQAKLIDRLMIEVADLKARVGMNPRNSSKPPSSEGYSKPSPKSRRVRSGKKPGKQPGTPGKNLPRRDEPDAMATHEPDVCSGCGEHLGGAPVVGESSRQVFDIPPGALSCIEHLSRRRRCSCGAETSGEFPPWVTAPTCYGPNMRARVCYLVTRQHIPIGRVAELLADTYGATVSTGTIVAMVNEGSDMLDEFLSSLQETLGDSPVVCADETGLRVAAKLHWVHSASTDWHTHYHVNTKRGVDAMNEAGILNFLDGVLVHDGWTPYRHYTNVDHQLCNAHHLRELQAVTETGGQPWADDMATLLSETWKQVLAAKAAGRTRLPAGQIERINTAYRQIIAAGHDTNPAPTATGKRGRPKRTKTGNLLNRLNTHQTDVLRFTTNFDIPFDNNLAERDIRMVKVHQKISGGFRTLQGATAFLNLRSYLSTANKHGIGALTALNHLYAGTTWTPALPAAGP
jgi:transposase